MDNEKLLKALGRLSVETGSPACLGCGWEHDCNTHGCAILRGVRFALEDAEARADEAEASLAAAVRDMEAMAATIRARPIDDTECCFLCKYDGPVEDYAEQSDSVSYRHTEIAGRTGPSERHQSTDAYGSVPGPQGGPAGAESV